ncbi:hypothetical protein N779_08360 [Vibrio coralliilyticus OCN008]|nr:hypothetical protein N779_08360 [Vibrio coralliilyticus OCN008]
MVALAIAITTLRITLPQLNRFQNEIQTWVNKGSTLDFEIDQISGFWRNTHPPSHYKMYGRTPRKAVGFTFQLKPLKSNLT